jgi:hypothetical protein
MRQKNLLILGTMTNVDPETGVMAGKRTKEESVVEEQLAAAAITHAQSSVVPVSSGNLFLQCLPCYARVTILSTADMSGGAGGVLLGGGWGWGS